MESEIDEIIWTTLKHLSKNPSTRATNEPHTYLALTVVKSNTTGKNNFEAELVDEGFVSHITGYIFFCIINK